MTDFHFEVQKKLNTIRRKYGNTTLTGQLTQVKKEEGEKAEREAKGDGKN